MTQQTSTSTSTNAQENCPKNTLDSKTSPLKLSLVEIIKAKEKALMDQVNAERSKPPELDFESKKQELGMMARSLKMYYASRKVSNMFMCQVIDYLFKSCFASLLEKHRIHDLVIQLCKWLPEW